MNKINKKEKVKAIVGIGASAGGLESLQMLLTNLPDDVKDIAIFIAQHMSPTYDSKLVELLSRKTNLKVIAATNGSRILPNTIFIAPPNHSVTLKNNSIFLSTDNQHSPFPSINELFISIANGDKSIQKIGIVLSGTGNDGTSGLQALKDAGGITIAQNPESAKYSGMPTAAIDSGNVDKILNPDEIGKLLIDFIFNRDHYLPAKETSTISEHIDELLNLLTQRAGIDFSNYKTSTIYRRLDKTISDRGINNIKAYLEQIREKPEEVDQLFFNLLIGVTQFFRDEEAFRKIKIVLKNLVENSVNNTIRVWAPGCATGEEAYSLAIIFDQLLRKKQFSFQVQIFATDINEKTIAMARKGIYSEASLNGMDQEILKTYFSKHEENTYQLAKHIRKMVLFSKHDVTSNPPFLRMDMISCRNLLIYFNSYLQQQVIPVFHYS